MGKKIKNKTTIHPLNEIPRGNPPLTYLAYVFTFIKQYICSKKERVIHPFEDINHHNFRDRGKKVFSEKNMKPLSKGLYLRNAISSDVEGLKNKETALRDAGIHMTVLGHT